MVKIAVIGSISTDFVVTSTRRPQAGETIFGDHFETHFGGKGANQAVACSRLGAHTFMLGAVGQDSFGDLLLTNLIDNDIETSHVLRKPYPSGSAIINVVASENSIIYVAGANQAYTPEDAVTDLDFLSTCDLVLIQNECAQEVIDTILPLLANKACRIIYNPAPARPFKKELMESIDFLTPNEHEFALMFPGMSREEVLATYPNKLIITLGAKGVIFHNGQQIVQVPSFSVRNIVDTTGAGDTFNGALAFALGHQLALEPALRFANLAAALSIQKEGAQTGMPTLDQMKGSDFFETTWDFE